METVYFNSYGGLVVLTNFSAHTVTFCVGGKEHVAPTAEHAYQWSKFYRSDPAHAERILQAELPAQAKRLGGRRGGGKLDPAWSAARSVTLMKALLLRKATQHRDVKEALLKTGHSPLVHRAPWDSFWGDGKDRRGRNMLGKLWEEIRRELAMQK